MAIALNERTFDFDVWMARLRDFLSDCVGSPACEERDRIREAGLLLQGMSLSGGASPDLAAIEAMLGCGAMESAVLAIMGPDVSFMLSRNAAGSCMATVMADGEDEEMIFEGATVTLALLAAHVSLLIARLDRDGTAEIRLPLPPSARLH